MDLVKATEEQRRQRAELLDLALVNILGNALVAFGIILGGLWLLTRL